MDTLPVEMPSTPIRITVDSHVKIPLHESFLMLLACFEGSEDKWTVRVNCPNPPNEHREYLAWMQPLMPTFPVPDVGEPFQLFLGTEKIGTAEVREYPTSFTHEVLGVLEGGLAVGTLVRVQISNCDVWHPGAAAAMNTRVGVVEEVHRHGLYRVKFAVPPLRWIMRDLYAESDQRIYCWNFEATNLQVISLREYEEAVRYAVSMADSPAQLETGEVPPAPYTPGRQ